MSATALYTVAMSPSDAFEYTRGALQAAGVLLGVQAPPAHIEFSLTRKDVETGSMDVVMPGRAVIAASGDGQATVTIAVDPATQFLLYAAGIGLVAFLFGGFLFGGLGNLWFLLILCGEAYLFWCVFNKWPGDALNAVRTKMQASPAVSGGAPIVQPSAPVYTPPAPPASAGDIADQIRHLAELRDQGHLTQEEFDAKKVELLKRI
ncbi:MAG TPA: SHOCT domain-containing protein [Rhizomicrobium sp.]